MFTAPGLLAQGEELWTQVQQRGILRVAADPTLGLPYFALKNGTYQGFEWELLQSLAQVLKLKLRMTEVLWPQQRQVLLQGSVDLIWNAQEAPDLAQSGVLTTQPYFITSQSILTAQPRSLKGLVDLVGDRVGVLQSSGGAALVDAYNLYRAKGIRPFTASKAAQLLEKLTQGQLEAVILDTPVAQWSRRGTGLHIAEVGLLPIPLVGVVRLEGISLRNALDRGLQELRQAGTLEMILRKWQLWNSLQTRSNLR